ncbi:MAG: hypothetical protein DHS20C03_24190 [Minwuia thermotolerans]|nr:MAG: hypothetical protein DHS20C03_24190 [Minwuia thermotolerans]
METISGIATDVHSNTNFKIDDIPIVFGNINNISIASLNISENDKITVSGKMSDEGFKCIAMKNHTNGTTHGRPPKWALPLAIIFVIISIPLSFLLIGIPFLVLSLFTIYLIAIGNRAVNMVDTTSQV